MSVSTRAAFPEARTDVAAGMTDSASNAWGAIRKGKDAKSDREEQFFAEFFVLGSFAGVGWPITF